MIRRYFIAGVLIWVPIWVTLLVIGFVANILDKSLTLLPEAYQPQHLLGFSIPGLGVVFTLLIVFITGVLVTNFLGHRLVAVWEAILAKIPFVSPIYSGVKQVLTTVFSSEGKSFKKVLLVEYPRRDIWTLAFQTGAGLHEVEEKLGQPMVSVFVPTTPNPTGGFWLMVPKRDVIELDISVDNALKTIISLGIVLPLRTSPTIPPTSLQG
ncbi:MAG: DUF502 domain-containing protein [Gammaproteobacteria bacterium]